MAIPFSKLAKTTHKNPPLLAIYGSGGVGKTTLAAEFPSPFYVFTEGERPPTDIELATLPDDNGDPKPVQSYNEMLDVFADLITGEHDFKTVIIDSLDSFERLVWAHTCAANGFSTIDSNDKGSPTAFGKGYLAADEFWNEYISAARALTERGLHVVQILHSEAKSFNDPIVDSYDRYRPKLQKRASDIVMEKSDALLFMTKRTSLKQIDKGFGKKESKPEGMSGSERVIYTDERAGFLAKNRLNMPASINYRKDHGFAELSKYFFGNTKNKESA